MDFEGFIKAQNQIEPIVKEALGQILQKELTLQKKNDSVENVKAAVSAENFPSVVMAFATAKGNVNHLLLVPKEFVLQFYAWMIADEPAPELSDEHFDGLKEGFDQIFGQIKMSLADDSANFVVDNFVLEQVNSPDDLPLIEEKPGVVSRYTVSGDEKEFAITYFVWGEAQAVEQAQTAEDQVAVQPAEFGPLNGNDWENGEPRNIDMLLDVNLEITVELDRKIVTVSELLKLGKGSIVELEKSAGEPLDIFVNGRKFAEGEVVVIDDKFGIRITQLQSPRERIKSLG